MHGRELIRYLKLLWAVHWLNDHAQSGRVNPFFGSLPCVAQIVCMQHCLGRILASKLNE
jgi:hypothetical protein